MTRYFPRSRASTVVGDWQTQGQFDPSMLAPRAWYDASDTATITASGNSVSQLSDKSGNGLHITQGTASAQPTTNTITRNGRNALSFDGGDRLVASSAADWPSLHNGTVFIWGLVFQAGTAFNPDAGYGLWSTGQAASTVIGSDFVWDNRSSVPRFNATLHQISNGTTGLLSASSLKQGTAQDNSWHVITCLTDPNNATASARINLQVETQTVININTATTAPSSSNPAWPLTVGSLGNNGLPFVGYFGELVFITDANATEANRVLLRNYLLRKWGF